VFRLRPIQPATLWLDASGFRPAPLFVRGVPRLVSARRAAVLLTFDEMEALQSDDAVWVQLSNSFRRGVVPFDVFSEVMHSWVDTAALGRLCYLINEHHGKFWKIDDLAGEMGAVTFYDIPLTMVESVHVAMCFTLLRGSRGVIRFGEMIGDDAEDASIIELARLVRRFGAAEVARYVTPGCSLSVVGHAIEHGIDPELLAAVDGTV